MNDINKTIKHFESLQKRYTTQHNGQMCERVADALDALYCFKSMEQNGVVGEFIGKPITVYYLQKILNDYFDIPNDTYAYNLTRDKHAFMIGTMGFDDFEEFDEDTTRDLAEYIIKCFDTQE